MHFLHCIWVVFREKISFWSQSYQTLISLFFRFLLLSLRVCSIGKYCLYIKMAKLNSKKRKKSLFYKKNSLVGLTPGQRIALRKCFIFIFCSFRAKQKLCKNRIRTTQTLTWKRCTFAREFLKEKMTCPQTTTKKKQWWQRKTRSFFTFLKRTLNCCTIACQIEKLEIEKFI